MRKRHATRQAHAVKGALSTIRIVAGDEVRPTVNSRHGQLRLIHAKLGTEGSILASYGRRSS